jgi:chemotaxis protein MotB
VEISQQIPAEINWVMRVDGHTDAVPISTPQFPSNWELSSARAIAVVKFLVEQGVPAYRLAATGFGEFQPLDPRSGEIANRRNRRIEFKLTQR